MKMLIAASAGGGHLIPAMEFARYIRASHRDVEIFFFVDDGAAMSDAFKAQESKFYAVTKFPMPYKLGLGFASFPIKLMKAFYHSNKALNQVKPDVVVGFGGYVSGPIVLSAAIRRVPTVIHEQNALPGRANRILAGFVGKFAASFDSTKDYMPAFKNKIYTTGMPVRAELLDFSKHESLKRLGMDEGCFTILVMGGSQGSHAINAILFDCLRLIDKATLSKMQFIHLSGRDDFEFVKDAYNKLNVNNIVYNYCKDMGLVYNASDMAITRAGGSTIAEILYCGLPAIFIPYPHAKNHQKYNVLPLAGASAGIMIEQKDLTAQTLKDNIINLFEDAALRKKISQNAKKLSRQSATADLARLALEGIKC